VLTSAIQDARGAGASSAALREASESLVLMMAPMAPHIAEELWRETLGHPETVVHQRWPSFDPALALEEQVVMVVEVDGKVRDRITVDADAGEDRCRELALASDRVQRALDGRSPARIIVRAPRLVNIVTRQA
jgi:leucyl-tRNA synthetase